MTGIKLFFLSLWLLVRLPGCRKIIRRAYCFPDFSDSDIELLDSWFMQSRTLQNELLKLLLHGQVDPLFLSKLDSFCSVIEVDLQDKMNSVSKLAYDPGCETRHSKS